MARILLISLLVTILSAGLAQAADLTGMVCEQSEAVVLRFGGDRAEKRKEKSTFRLDANKLYARDANNQEHEYPVQFISGPRYQAENWTMIFNPDLTGADVALVTMTDVQMSRWRCEKVQQ